MLLAVNASKQIFLTSYWDRYLLTLIASKAYQYCNPCYTNIPYCSSTSRLLLRTELQHIHEKFSIENKARFPAHVATFFLQNSQSS